MRFFDFNVNSSAVIIVLILYGFVLVFTIVRILLDTNSTPKTLAYILLVALFPVLGVLFFYAFGGDYRHVKITAHRYKEAVALTRAFNKENKDNTSALLKEYENDLMQYKDLVKFIYKHSHENLNFNDYHLLENGENKFPEVLKELEKAKSFIHIEYYAWENDVRGNQIKEVLLKKAKEGVKVRVLVDAFASRGIEKNIVKELNEGGAEVHPFIKIIFTRLASRTNHRDHRKIIIIDGVVGFVGGINVSDRYDNSIDTGLYWRDTHVKIMGESVNNLQRHFIICWNAADQTKNLTFKKELFPNFPETNINKEKELAQIVAGGPLDNISNIMLTYFKIFTLATQKLYITNPYFVPNSSILNALKQAAITGVDVRILVPKKSDSALVGATTNFYFKELLEVGVKIYLYEKGFIHAKTLVADSYVSVVGTANMDLRSFDLNFEIMSVIYGNKFAAEMERNFLSDLENSELLNYADWMKQSNWTFLKFATARLISSFL
ncbi:cardiolipin synthase [Namhaeicola litoreus]|uniref:Cardiolipin synthase n=1 Tax=Namhaeicola litoreus TaxID=1052145 RepID=A0ABW3XWW0_9FLAO